jgi:hypothetical protein
MKLRIIGISVVVLLLVFVLGAGCTDNTAAPKTTTPAVTTIVDTAATTAPAATATVAKTTQAPSLTPGPTQTLPEIWSAEIEVKSNGEAIDPQVIMTFRGGKGMNVIPAVILKVTRSDGDVKETTMYAPLSVGKTVSLPGTTQNNDRAEVWVVTPQNERVKVIDKYVPFRSYN